MHLREKHKIHQVETIFRRKEISTYELKGTLWRNSKDSDCQKKTLRKLVFLRINHSEHFKLQRHWKLKAKWKSRMTTEKDKPAWPLTQS